MAKDTIASLRRDLDSLESRLNERLHGLEQEKLLSNPNPNTNDKMLERLLTAMCDGLKIEAIKECRAMCGIGLKEAKDLIEKYWHYTYKSGD